MDKKDVYRVAEGVNLEIVASRIKENSTNKTKKASKKGAFMIFVNEHLERWKSEGKNVSTMRNAVETGDKEWRNLSIEEKAIYKEKAAPQKVTLPIPIISKHNKEEIDSVEKKYQAPIIMDQKEKTKTSGNKKVRASPTFNSDEDEGIGLEPAIETSRIKPLSIIYEENEEDLSSSGTEEVTHNFLETKVSESKSFTKSSGDFSVCSYDDIKGTANVIRNGGRNLKYPLRRPSNASLIAKRKLNFNSSEDSINSNKDNSMEINVCSLVSPDNSSNYLDVKSSSPVKNNDMKSDLCDLSPIKVEKLRENQLNNTSQISTRRETHSKEDLVSSIEKLIKQAEDLMNDSLWDMVC